MHFNQLSELIFELESEWDAVRRELMTMLEDPYNDSFERGVLFGRGEALEKVIKKLRGIPQ